MARAGGRGPGDGGGGTGEEMLQQSGATVVADETINFNFTMMVP